jgi:hypothetical protein
LGRRTLANGVKLLEEIFLAIVRTAWLTKFLEASGACLYAASVSGQVIEVEETEKL